MIHSHIQRFNFIDFMVIELRFFKNNKKKKNYIYNHARRGGAYSAEVSTNNYNECARNSMHPAIFAQIFGKGMDPTWPYRSYATVDQLKSSKEVGLTGEDSWQKLQK